MTEQVPDPLADDPFFRVVHARHPDVDLVILPPAVPAPTEEPPGTHGRARALVDGASTMLEDLFGRVGQQPGTRVSTWSSVGRSGRRRFLVRAIVGDLEPGTAVPLLREIGDALLAMGWDARPYDDGSPRLLAVRGDLRCASEAFEDSVRLAVDSVPLVVTDATISALETAS